MKLEVWVISNARRTEIKGFRNGMWILGISAPAREGRANAAGVRYLADLFGVSRSSVRLLAGEKSRHKKFEIIGLDAGHAQQVLTGLLTERQPRRHV